MIHIKPIADDNLFDVCTFLHQHLDNTIPVDKWAMVFQRQWHEHKPNNGFMLLEAGMIVGAVGCLYSRRGGVDFCNFTSWCVLEDYRAHSLKLILTALSQKQYCFTNLSASATAEKVFRSLKFQYISNDLWIVPVLPSALLGVIGKTKIYTNPALFPKALNETGQIERQHHQHCQQVLLQQGTQQLWIVYSIVQKKGVRCVKILHNNNEVLFKKWQTHVSLFFLKRGVVCMLLEQRLHKDHRPLLALTKTPATPKMFFSRVTYNGTIDNLYTEQVG